MNASLAGLECRFTGGRQPTTRPRVARNDAEFTKKAAAAPNAATTNPPSAGPTERATLYPALLAITASGTWARLTISGMMADHAGAVSAAPSPRANVNASRTHG